MSDQQLQVTLVGKDISASQSLYNLARAASQAAKSAGASMEAMNREVSESSQRTTRTATSGIGSSLASWAETGLAGVLGGIAASVTSTVSSVVGDAGQAIMTQLKASVIDYNSQLENATIGFTTMLGSGQKANAFLGTLQKFAARTPFEFGDLTSYAQQMIGYGINVKNVVPYLTALGDAAAGAGKSGQDLGNAVLAFEQMAARGKVDLGDLNQLTNAGIPGLAILASKYHVSKGALLGMISAGKIASGDALPKLISGIEHGTKSTSAFGGMMSKQSHTFAGAMSNIKDSVDQTLSTAFKPFYTGLEHVTGRLSKFATSKSVQKWSKDTSKEVGGWMKTVGGGIKEVFSDPKLQSSLRKLGKALSDAFKAIGPALKQMMPDAVKFGKAVLPAIADAATQIAKHFPEVLDVLRRVGHVIANNAPTIAAFIRGFGQIESAAMKMTLTIDRVLASVAETFTSFYTTLGQFFSPAITWLLQAGKDIVQGLINGVNVMVGKALNAIGDLARKLPQWAKDLLGIASPSKVFKEIGKYVGQGLEQGLLGSVEQVQTASKHLAGAVVSAFKAGDISKATERSALGVVDRITDRLQALAKRRADVEKRLAASRSNLSDIRSNRADLIASTKTSTIESAGVMNADSSGGMLQNLEQTLTNTRKFKTDLQRLSRMGVDSHTFAQLVTGWQSDPQAALAAADQLIGNPMDLKQIVALQRKLNGAAASLGAYAGGAEYDAAARRARGQVVGLSARDQVLGFQMQSVAANGVRRVAGDLHININLAGHYAGTKEDLAKTVTHAIRDAVKKGQLPKNILTAL